MGGPDRDAASGAREIRSALAESGRSFLAVGLFSAFVNLLMLTGPVFMLQVYDRVLSSRSEATLVALIGIVAFLFLAMGLLDHFRARVLARAGARFQARMDPRVLGAILTRAGGSPEARSAPATGLADLEAMQRFASGPGPFAFFDAPWTPIFLAVLFLFHWMLGLLAVFAGVLLLVLALVNQARTSRLGEQVLDAVDARMRANPAPGAEMVVRTASDALSGAGGTLAAADSKTTRLRFGFEGSRPFRLGDGSVLTPGIEIGVRRDGGDAENGFGTEIGAGLAWADPKRGLGAELRGRGLLSHEAQGFRQRGLAGALTWNPVAGDRGPRLSLTRTLGVPAQRGPNTPLAPTTLTGPASNEPGNGLGERRLEARFGYGFPAFGGRFTSTPEIAVGLSDAGRDYSLGWRLVRGGDTPDGSALELVVEARRRESASGRNDPPGHAVGVRVMSRF